MCGKGTFALIVLAGLVVCPGLGQNAEPGGRRYHDSRNFPTASDFESQREDFWDVPPEGVRTTRLGEAEAPEEEEESGTPRGGGNENAALTRKSFDLQQQQQQQRISNASTRLELQEVGTGSRADSRQLQADRRRKKRRRGKQPAPWREAPERENLVNVGSCNCGHKKLADGAAGKKGRGWAGKYREERRRRRRNRKRTGSRLRLEGRREEHKWRDNPLARLIKILNEQRPEARLLSSNPLNLSSTRLTEDDGVMKLVESSNDTSSSSYPSQLTTEPRIPEPPEPTSRYHVLPSEVEREFSRHVERELSRAQLAGKSADEEAEVEDDEEEDEAEEEEEAEESPRFDERYAQATKRPEDLDKSPFDPERMLGYSRTDEDLPILDMENEVLQRTLKDYNAYMSSSVARAAKAKNDYADSEHRRLESNESSSSTEPSVFLLNDDDPQGDLSCINGTFLPAPFVQHAVIKYVKSSRPGHEYLEADYECEPGYAMIRNATGGRLLCRNRRWIGRLPSCKFHGDDETTCAHLGCEQLCRIVNGKAECQCHEGYRLEGQQCIDIDECESNEGRGPCEDTCRNLAGGFECTCEGQPGSVLAPDNRTCQASTSSPCSINNAGCSHTCLASMGRVFCLCPDGFMLEDDWKTCQDVDECAVPDLQTEICHYGCINTPGSYRCAPAPQHPIELLKGILTRRQGVCQLGYQLVDKNCVDINECAINNGGCSEVCENTEGSFFCACEGDERILSADRRSCVVAEKRFEAMDRESLSLHLRDDVSCTPLNPVGRGYLLCSDTGPSSTETTETRQRAGKADGEREPIRPGTKCYLKCPHGYELHGEYELTCRADGTWDGPKHGECLRYGKPRLDCPKDVVAELPPGHDEAFVTYDQPSTDLDWFRYVHSKPSWGTRLEANLKTGIHEIAFYARHPVSKKQTSCTLKITVEEGQAPKVKGCPSDIEVTGKNGSAITWVEPVFTDNVKVTRVTSNESPGQTFSVGGHKVEYEASDEAGWTTKCIFTVVLRPAYD